MLMLAIVMAFVIGVFWAGPVGAEGGNPCAALKKAAEKLGCPGALVEKTGQTTSYTAIGGEDGDLEKGVAWPNPRFTDNNDGTVTDNLTGLIWLRDASRFGYRTWYDALNDCNALADDGTNLTDGSSAGAWRLPNVKERQSLIDYGSYDPALPSGHPFSGVVSNDYWSSTTDADFTDDAWVVYLFYGYVYYYHKDDGSLYVWPVRGGE